jgi:hypothetical protein
VQVTFKRNASGQLQFDQIERVSPIGEWFLALEGSESSESPLLLWKTVEPTPAKDGIVIRDLELAFTLFETNWTIALSPLTFRQGDTDLQQTYTFSNPSPAALLPDRTTLKLDLDKGNHALDFFLQVRLGDLSLPRSTFAARIHFPLLPNTSAISAESVSLFGGLKLIPSDAQPIVVEWLNGGGLRIKQPTLLKADQPALKIIQACRTTNELTIEAWIQLEPNQMVAKGLTPIVTLSSDPNNRYFTLAQGRNDDKPGNLFTIRLRSDSNTNSNGTLLNGSAPIATNPGSAKSGLSHLVFTRRADGLMKVYIDGQEQASNTVPNKLFPVYANQNTDQTFRFGLANEIVGDRPWLGDYRQIAIFNRALPATEVKQRFDRGVGSASRGQQRLAYPWSTVGLQIFTGNLSQAKPNLQVAHHAAATELPARLRVGNQANPLPVNLAVSPYLGLEFRPVLPNQKAQLRLLTAELLCLNRTTGKFLPAASHMWAVAETNTESQAPSSATYYSTSQTWARETHSRLCPNSPIAILRFRELQEMVQEIDPANAQTTNKQPIDPLLTTYRFALVTDLEQPRRLVKHVVQLRSTVAQLRFREGQLGAFTMPTAIKPFELAPPQVTAYSQFT